ncbi:putative methyltransferase YcgJ [Ktedonobacter sp. SOSP1-52]|uniref:class I SAM-dependent methyltransferase n=1 Tax=Ktedonobacter sp. SOSP1-52 TaxID=2778366 RepID=UPI001916AD2A|nr:class I SAM-dependent methyltransferase [Ktedonobacter sp. SOSP1-52]GHO69239.1 putative methyltransferase YcgJ [Ktedonobacter sp. SOSP1-52]
MASMSQPSKDDIKRQFGRMSHAYVESVTHAKGHDLQLLLNLLAPQVGMRVLDIATGGGHTALAVAPYVQEVVASDLTPEMLERVQELCQARGVTNISTQVADVEDLPFPDAAFDAVTCRIAPHHFLDIERAVHEIARVLRPGGIFALEDSLVPEAQELDQFINTVEKMRDPTHVRSYSEMEWRRFLEQAGFRVGEAQIFRKTHTIADWLRRAGVDEATRQGVYQAFVEASPAAREHYEISFLDDGTPVTFTDDKLLLRAEKA